MLVWTSTVASTVAAITTTVTHWRRHRRTNVEQRYSTAFYLDDNRVMDLYRQHGGKYKAALRHEIEEKIGNSRDAGVSVGLAPVQASGRRTVNSEILHRYIEQAKPITVIGIIIDVLDKADDIVNVNLLKREVIANRALDKVLDNADDGHSDPVRLRDVDAFVSVRGRFRLIEQTNLTATFQAPYGSPNDPADGPQVHITCIASGLRRPPPQGSFPARCLGQVLDWDPQTHRLVLDPIAIFN